MAYDVFWFLPTFGDTAARDILNPFAADRHRIEALGRPAGSALRVHQLLQTKPILSIVGAAETPGLSAPAVAASIGHLAGLGVVRELTGRQRGRLFVHERSMEIMSRGTKERTAG